jgi:hypothetical protein
MMYRFDQTKQLCHEITWDFEKKLKKAGEKTENGACLRVFNPLPYHIKKNITVQADLSKMPKYAEPFACYGDDIPAFKLLNTDGNEITYGYVKHCKGGTFEITFDADLIPMGITEFALVPSDMPTRYPQRLLTSTKSAKGDYTSITVNNDGTVDADYEVVDED